MWSWGGRPVGRSWMRGYFCKRGGRREKGHDRVRGKVGTRRRKRLEILFWVERDWQTIVTRRKSSVRSGLRKRNITKLNRRKWSYGSVKLSRHHDWINMFFLLLSILSHIVLLFLITYSFSLFFYRSECRRAWIKIKVKTDLRNMFYEVLRRVLLKPSDAPVFFVFSKWRITITTASVRNFKKTRRFWFRSVHERRRLVQMYP